MALIPFLIIAVPAQAIVVNLMNKKWCKAGCDITLIPVSIVGGCVTIAIAEILYSIAFLIHLSGLTTLKAVFSGGDAGRGYFNERNKNVEDAEYGPGVKIHRAGIKAMTWIKQTFPNSNKPLPSMPDKKYVMVDLLKYFPQPTKDELKY